MITPLPPFDPKLDLKLEREIDVPVERVWAAWTRPEHLRNWFVPRPWTISACEIDLRPGGMFRTTMRSPEGEEHPNNGCYLEVVPNRRLVWTDALVTGYRPAPKAFLTAFLDLEATATGTRYVALAMHADAEIRDRHETMGFYDGWGTALDQMVEYIKAN